MKPMQQKPRIIIAHMEGSRMEAAITVALAISCGLVK